ncbi:MAG: PDZ domain-containing protein [Chloroflexi bacterium]|nr:PDZ domain-containing protein [Chloroflexota bacterium]
MFPEDEDVLIESLVEGEAAEQYGLQAGDIILEVDGETMPDIAAFREVLGSKFTGDTITITVQHDDETLMVNVVLGSR